ncbi:MAG: hypothetical protein ACYC7D_01320 [Nitrososphaerales archaeon]
MLEGLKIFAEAEVKNTESKQKVANAISKILTQGNLQIEDNRVTFSSDNIESLKFMKDQFRDRRVRSAARRLLLKNSSEIQTQILLNKQAATVGIAALCDDPRESALGPIVLQLRARNILEVIEWLAHAED